jgi:integrin beta 3
MTPFTFTLVQLFSNPRTTHGKIDCDFNGHESAYRGSIHTTQSGRSCQHWTAQEPHEHTRTPASFPNAGLGNHNFCRNPDGEATVWCFTEDPDKEWEYCNVCSQYVNV